MDTKSPHPEALDTVETSLYNRMLRNAFIGFAKAAAIGAVIGLALGGIGGALNLSFLAEEGVFTGALKGAAWLAGVAGSFGAVAGIQSTRDTRRFFLMHENRDASSPEQTTERALTLSPEAPQQKRASLEVIDKHTPQYLDRIGKKELGLLVHMLEDLDHSALEPTARAYGYRPDGRWDETALAAYKTGRLHDRMNNENYTFFVLRDEQDRVVAVASGNALEDRSQLRVMNFTVDREHRHKGYGKELMKRIAHYADEQGFVQMVMPLSHHAIAKDNIEIYQRMAGELGIETALRPHPWDPKAKEFVAAPKKFLSLSHAPLMSNDCASAVSYQVH